MLLHELVKILLSHEVVLILLPLKGWNIHKLVSGSRVSDPLLNLLIIVTQSWNLASFPGVMANVDGVLNWHEEGEAIYDYGPFIDVSPHSGVRCLDLIVLYI